MPNRSLRAGTSSNGKPNIVAVPHSNGIATPEDIHRDPLNFTYVGIHDPWAKANESDNCVATSSKKPDSKAPRVGHTIYALQFNPQPPADLVGSYKYLVALVTAEFVILVRVSADGKAFEHVEVSIVPSRVSAAETKKDKKDKPSTDCNEDLYTVHWIKDPRSFSTWSAVAVAGRSGVIRVIDYCAAPARSGALYGHAGAVNELCYCEEHPRYLLSASKDHTIRLWSIGYLTCLAIFKGAQGHTAEIITLDMHINGRYFVSGAYDNSIKIWNLFGPDNSTLLEVIRVHAVKADIHPALIDTPVFSVKDVHDRQIDCVRWIHQSSKTYFLMSKASDERIKIWTPSLSHSSKTSGIGSDWQICYTLNIPNSKFWFVKFDYLRHPFYRLAIGDDLGCIKIFDLFALAHQRKQHKQIIKTKKNRPSSPNKAVVRCVAFSKDGLFLAAGTDEGMIHMFGLNGIPASKSNNSARHGVTESGSEDDMEDY
ncbi:polycomb protein esc-like [Paramacrobiotus metropolitanus]|uniref:polycomb protein esc-like n=1 Tax=Paramacrobiotus metropolitanus TaxID=2943436 RepID=UPI002445CC7A|nr:polycomb protein esc-like [Paramacrobiotus metropolitanus]